MRPMPKLHPFRSKRLRELASKTPHCMLCREPNTGNIVLAHSNCLADGKGMGMKAHDIPCYLCPTCHDYIDGRLTDWSLTDRERMRLEGTYNSVLWLLQEGYLKVVNHD
jgi:hypothetical protein